MVKRTGKRKSKSELFHYEMIIVAVQHGIHLCVELNVESLLGVSPNPVILSQAPLSCWLNALSETKGYMCPYGEGQSLLCANSCASYQSWNEAH